MADGPRCDLPGRDLLPRLPEIAALPEAVRVTDEPEAGRDKLTVENMDLGGSSFTGVSLKDAAVRDANLMNALVDDVNAKGLRFHNANLSDATFSEVNLSGASIQFANLTGLSRGDANVTDMTINGIKVSDMIALWEKTHGAQG